MNQGGGLNIHLHLKTGRAVRRRKSISDINEQLRRIYSYGGNPRNRSRQIAATRIASTYKNNISATPTYQRDSQRFWSGLLSTEEFENIHNRMRDTRYPSAVYRGLATANGSRG